MASQQELLDQLQAQMEDPNRMPTPDEDQQDLTADVDSTDKAGAAMAAQAPGAPSSNPILAAISTSQSKGAQAAPADDGATDSTKAMPTMEDAPPEAAPKGPSDSERLGSAQQQANKQSMMANLLRSFQGALSGASRGNYKGDNSVANSLDENAKANYNSTKDQISTEAANRKEGRDAQMQKIQMDEFQQKLMASKLNFQDMQANQDPASPQSKLAQDRVLQMQKEMGQPVNEQQIRQTDGTTLFKYFPYLQQDLAKHYQVQQWEDQRQQQSKENDLNRTFRDKMLNEQIASRKEITQSNNETKAQIAKDKAEAEKAKKQSENDNKDAMKLNDYLQKGWTARGGNAGVVQNKIISAEAAEKLIEQGRAQPNGLTKSQIEELAQNMGKLLGGSNSQASARIQALVPHTMLGQAQDWKSYLTGLPQGAKQQEFVDMMADTIKREKELAQEQKMKFMVEGLPAHARLRNSNPDLYNNMLSGAHIDPSMINEKGQYQAPAGTTTKMIDPDGNVREVPNDQVEAAKAAGGHLVNEGAQ